MRGPTYEEALADFRRAKRDFWDSVALAIVGAWGAYRLQRSAIERQFEAYRQGAPIPPRRPSWWRRLLARLFP